jgi:transposase
MLADELDYVVGVDTHRDQHVLAVVVAPTGALIAQRSVPANAQGYAEAIGFAERHAPGARVWAVEGAGHYGAGLTRCLSARGEVVHESGRSSRAERRLRGKDDPLDATRAARSALASNQPASPRSGQRQEALRVLLLTRRSAVDVRRVALVQLPSVIVTAPDDLRNELRRLPLGELLRRCSRFRRSSSRTPDQLATILALRSLAQRIQTATHEAETSNAKSSLTSEHSRPTSWPSPVSARSSPHN